MDDLHACHNTLLYMLSFAKAFYMCPNLAHQCGCDRQQRCCRRDCLPLGQISVMQPEQG